jgi:mono/diheme cytochrome c family protein
MDLRPGSGSAHPMRDSKLDDRRLKVSDEGRFSATIWGIVALGAVLLGLAMAVLAGYFLGHFTGHTKTTTVAASEVGAGETTAAPKEAPPGPETTAETEAEPGPAETTEAKEEGGTTEGAGGAAKVEEGKQAFTANGCSSCHTLAAAGASGTVGPDLEEVLPGKSAAFIEESIVEPEAQIAPGYPRGVMPSTFKASLSSSELEALVAFLVQEAGK